MTARPLPDFDGIRLTDTTLRDGSHAVRHRFTVDQVEAVIRGLDDAGVPVAEVSHGDGLGGSSFAYGMSGTDELRLIERAAEAASRTRIATLLVPGIGTVERMREAASAGAQIVRVATHCTEADVSVQHFTIAREIGLETAGFLMLAHRAAPAELAAQARIMADAGCQCIYVVDSAGALLPHQVTDRVDALLQELGDDAQVGMHAHLNLGVGVANSLAAARAGARQIDGTLCGLGAGAGNSPTEQLVAVFERAGLITHVDLDGILAIADRLPELVGRLPRADRAAIVQGYAGVYSSFLLHAERIGADHGVPTHELLAEAGRRGYVGGQEDLLLDIAVEFAAR
ncbi:4-hydroxy-2-oxovalerate aldolase [Agromyces archimandritae]|uniref:4-hydroxy-2-oxovalerate aldolase n=1 Tax=Agromyces archimandritae TaxID=2781962 RepID=A0A975FNY1_9MICO|nr:4-hydroxy-2-oxovalerate aldolase [Agromyces archimandritae]QTX05665.1 4-hydroxy-2-oxovalerate aldolase [Agromyces archimandritae]